MPHERDVRISNRWNDERGTGAAGSGDGRVGSGKPVQRVAVIGEWGAGNEWSEQRCPENRTRGKLEGRDRTMRHRARNAVFVVCPKFLFLKKNDDGDVSLHFVVGLSVS